MNQKNTDSDSSTIEIEEDDGAQKKEINKNIGLKKFIMHIHRLLIK
jgi:hypothetical protein